MHGNYTIGTGASRGTSAPRPGFGPNICNPYIPFAHVSTVKIIAIADLFKHSLIEAPDGASENAVEINAGCCGSLTTKCAF